MRRQPTVLRVGIDDAPPVPMQSGDPAAGTFCGFEVDLLNQLAARLQYRLEYHRAWWSLITAELVSGSLEAVCSAATITEERKAEVSFCDAHLRLRLALVTRQDVAASSLTGEARYGVRRGTTAAEYLRSALGITPHALSESNADLYEALRSGEIDAVVDDSPIARHFAAATPGLRYVGPYEGTDGAYAIMLAKNNDTLRSEINTVLRQMETEGTLPGLRKRWFGTSAILVA